MKMLSNKCSIAMVLYKYYSSDTRVLRESLVLANNGYTVDVINLSNPESKNPTNFMHEGIKDIQVMNLDVNKRENIVKLL